MAVTVPADQAARDRIASSLDETLVVEAAAGTGKTTALVGRLINVLATGRGRVGQVVAVTFTEVAAGDLTLRLRGGLELARQRADSAERRRYLEDAIAHLEEARVGTIHALCADLLRERPVEARVDPDFRVVEETDAEELYGRAFSDWIQASLHDPPDGIRRALRRQAERDGPLDRLRTAGLDLVRWRHLRAPWRRPAFDRHGRLNALVDRLHTFADHLATAARQDDTLFLDTWAARRLNADIKLAEQAGPRDFDALEGDLITLAHDEKFEKPRRGSPGHYTTGPTRDEILSEHADLLGALLEFERDADADLAAALQVELRAPLDGYEALKARRGVLDYTDLLVKTRDVLRDRADVRAALQQRFTHLFVDEFQDTDPLQVEILLLLVADDPSVSDWHTVRPISGKLFVVGDPKQSIYRFRGADVGMYQTAKALLCDRGAAVLELTTSFRAVPPLQQFVNRAFSTAMHEDRRTFQAAYVPLTEFRAVRDQTAIVALPVPRPFGMRGDVTKTAIRASVPDTIAGFVEWLVRRSGWTVTERDRDEPVPVDARHICLLFRKFSDWGSDLTQAYAQALEARDIPHLLVGGKSFHAREEVESLRTALAAIEWPDDQLSVFATLKGPFFAIADEDLLEWRHRFGRLHPFHPPLDPPAPGHLAPIVEALDVLRTLHRRRNTRPVEETIHDLFTATRAHAGLVLRPRGEQALANAMRVADLARGYEATGGLSFRGFIDRLQREAQGEAPEAPILEEGSEGVRIMTVHKAKGLEFPVVILADPTSNLGSRRASRYVDTDASVCAIRLAGWSPWDLLDHEADELDREGAEGLRIAYVAATRARDLLVVPTLGDDPFDGGWRGADDSWMAAVQRATYPAAAARRGCAQMPGCPGFGPDGVVERPAGESAGPRTVRPGLHTIDGTDGTRYQVAWWDPHVLRLDAPPVVGVRREDLIVDTDADTVADGQRRYDEWREARERIRDRGRRPSLTVEIATAAASRSSLEIERAAAEVEIVDAGLDIAKPGGRRFGSLIHAVLATIPFDATREQIAVACDTHGRILAATGPEVDAARRIVEGLLGHPLLRCAQAAWKAGKCRREAPVTWVDDSGTLVEGLLDLAFEDGDGWTILDFKTDTEIAHAEPHYRRQVALYASAVAEATGKRATGILVRM
jgi:ATP-dependent helicase/nuclease subunit A